MRGRWLAVPLALSTAGCGVLDPTFTATTPGPSGKAPVEVRVDVEGNQAFGDLTLREVVADPMFDLSRDPTRESTVYDAALELEDHYRANGYPAATVAYEYHPVEDEAPWPATVPVRFVVREGSLVTVTMELRGNRAYSTDELLALWPRRRSGALGLGGDLFVEAEIRTFVADLRTFLVTHGRLDARVAGPELSVDFAAGTATAAVEVDEGHVHTVRTAVVGERIREALGAALPPPPVGQPRTPRNLDDWRTALREALRAAGHHAPQVEIVERPADGEPFGIALSADGDPGPVATVASLSIHGNERTLDGTILGRTEIEPGERYDGRKVDASLRNLHTTGLFRRVELTERPRDDDPTRLDLDLSVDELESRSIELLGGYGSYELLRGGVRLEERNLLGTGRGIALETRGSLKGYSTGLSLTDPDFLATDTTLTLQGEYFRREEPSYTDKAIGGTLSLARQVAERLTLRVGYTYRDRTDPIALTALARDRLVDFVEGAVFVELHHDRRDSVLFPRRGHAEFVSFERIAPELGATVDLDRATLRATRYLPIGDTLTIALRAEVGALWPHEGSASVPLQERWFNGGENSVRSFRESQLGPRDGAGQPIGGEFRNLFGIELRAPLWRTLEAGVFVDAGNVGAEIQDFGVDRLGWALGTGVRWLLPIGPVRLDAAFNPDRRPGEQEWVLHLSVGYPF